MSAIGAKYKWKEGKILHAARLWKAPTMRRIPRMLIEDRALEVGVLMYVEEPWMIFEETKEKVDELSTKSAQELEFYQNRFYLLPSEYEGMDTYDWLKQSGNALLLWGAGTHYYIQASKRP